MSRAVPRGGPAPGRRPPGGDVLDAIRSACAQVAAGARHVQLVEEALAPFARALPPPEEVPGLDPAFHWLGRGDDSAVFVLLLDAVNFGSGWSEHLAKPPGCSTYFTTAGALRAWFGREGPPSPARVAALAEPEVARIFGQEAFPPGHPARELTGLWTASLAGLAGHVLARHGGDWLGPVRAASGRASALVTELGALPSYADVARWHGLPVPFYKRAQITCSDLALAGGWAGPSARDGSAGAREWWGRFEDLDRLTIFADNLVPHVLRVEGVLRYRPRLLARIDAGEPLPAGSEEEVEIRALGLHAVERLVDLLRAEGRPATAMAIDQVLWNRGQSPAIKRFRRHRTCSRFY